MKTLTWLLFVVMLGFTVPVDAVTFPHDQTLSYSGTTLTTSASLRSTKIKAFGVGKVGFVYRNANSKLCYAEWVNGSVTKCEEISTDFAYTPLGLEYYNNLPKIGGIMTGTSIREYSKQSDGSWSASTTGVIGRTYYDNASYSVDPTTGKGAFFLENSSNNRVYVYRNAGGTWTSSTIETNKTSACLKALCFTPSGTPFVYWNNGLNALMYGGAATGSIPSVGAEVTQYHPCNLAADEANNIHLVHCDSNHYLQYRQWNGSGWTAASAISSDVLLSSSAFLNVGFSVGPDPDARFVLYGTTNTQTRLCSWNPSSSAWNAPETVLSSAPGSLGLTHDTTGNLYGLYVDSTYQLHLLYQDIVTRNLIADSSFESPEALITVPGKSTTHFLDKIAVLDDFNAGNPVAVGAHHGTHVLNYRTGVTTAITKALMNSTVIITSDTASFSIWARVRNNTTANNVTLALALYNSYGNSNVLSLTSTSIPYTATGWQKITASGIDTSGVKNMPLRLAFTITCPNIDCEVDFDQAGLFEGSLLPSGGVGDNAEYHFIEAEDLANGSSWKTAAYRGDYCGNPQSYSSNNSNPVLSGYEACTSPPAAVWNTFVKNSGTYNLWCRFLTSTFLGGFTVTAYQDGNQKGSLTISENAAKYGAPWQNVWDSLQIVLNEGPVQVQLTRPATAASWTTRRVDVMLLTNIINNASYQPDINDFVTPVYMRYTDQGTGGNAYCIYTSIRHAMDPWYSYVGMISRTGESNGSSMPSNVLNRLGSGGVASSPWIRLSHYLYQVPQDIDRIKCIATRTSSTTGWVTETLLGKLEFASGDNHSIISSQQITINQTNPEFLFTVPGNIAVDSTQILTDWEYYSDAITVVNNNQPPSHPPVEHFIVCPQFDLDPQKDDFALFNAEVALFVDMGFNDLFESSPVLNKGDYGLLNTSGINCGLLDSTNKSNGCFNQLITANIDADISTEASKWDAVNKTNDVVRFKVADECRANSMDHVTSCSICSTAFNTWVQTLGLSIAYFDNIASWSQATPKTYEQATIYPTLYYYTQIFRFYSFGQAGKTCGDRITLQLPNARCFNNFADTVTDKPWVSSDNEPILSIRGGFKMGWTEDWRGWGAGPMQSSYVGAIMRTACKPEAKPFGEYVVIKSGAKEEISTKFYEALSSGATTLCAYSYGPTYLSGGDAWSGYLDYYPYIMNTLAEFGNLDTDFNGTTRRQADVAVLFNRTAQIWEAVTDTAQNSSEMDAQFIYWALRHAGYNVDVIPEEDVENSSILNNYKTLYVTGRWIKASTATAISTWINSSSGRVLVGTAGAGSKDERNAALSTLNTIFGISGSTLTMTANAGKPSLDMKNLADLTTGTVLAPSSTQFKLLAWKESLTLSTATSIGTDTQSNIIAARRAIGSNYAVRYGFLPGVTYLHEAWSSVSPYNAATPIGFPTGSNSVQSLITYGTSLSGATKIATTNLPLLELTRYDKSGKSIIFLINHAYPAGSASVSLTIPDCASTSTVESIKGNSCSFGQQGTSISVNLTMAAGKNTDILVITHN